MHLFFKLFQMHHMHGVLEWQIMDLFNILDTVLSSNLNQIVYGKILQNFEGKKI
jgi:hypothetical protein